MTGGSRRANAARELDRARRVLAEASDLLRLGHTEGTVSRAYYAVLHAARALLFSVGVEPRSHEGLRSLLGEHFVLSGRLSPEMGRLVSRMQRDREDADYESTVVVTAVDARDAVDSARRFVAESERLLSAIVSLPDPGGASVREPRVRYRPSTGSGRVPKGTRKTPVKPVRSGPVRKRTT